VFALTSVNEQIFVSVRLGGAAGVIKDQLMRMRIVSLVVFKSSIAVSSALCLGFVKIPIREIF